MNFLEQPIINYIIENIKQEKLISTDDIHLLVNGHDSHIKAIKGFLFLYCLHQTFQTTKIKEFNLTQSGFGLKPPLDIRFLNEDEQTINIEHLKDNFYLKQVLLFTDRNIQFMVNTLLDGKEINIRPNPLPHSNLKNPILIISDVYLQVNYKDMDYMFSKSNSIKNIFEKIELEVQLKENNKTSKIKI
jgi:hypothetical protein